MNAVKKITMVSIVLAGFSVWWMTPAAAHAQASTQSLGTWVHSFSGGFGQITMQFTRDGSYRMVTSDPYGKVFTDSGRYTIIGGVMLTRSTTGAQARLYFFWMGPDLATIRVVPENSHRNVEATFARVR